jgi:hypothetical protein
MDFKPFSFISIQFLELFRLICDAKNAKFARPKSIVKKAILHFFVTISVD